MGIYIHAAWLIADPQRITQMNDFIRYALSKDNVVFATMSEVGGQLSAWGLLLAPLQQATNSLKPPQLPLSQLSGAAACMSKLTPIPCHPHASCKQCCTDGDRTGLGCVMGMGARTRAGSPSLTSVPPLQVIDWMKNPVPYSHYEVNKECKAPTDMWFPSGSFCPKVQCQHGECAGGEWGWHKWKG